MNNQEIDKLDFSDWPVPEKFVTEIGRISALWSNLESLLNFCIGKLAGFDVMRDPKAFILVNHANFPQRLDMLGTLCELLEPNFSHLAGYEKVISQLKTAQTTRNRYAHNGMSCDAGNDRLEMPTGSARGKLKVQTVSISLADLKRASMEIDEAARALHKLVLRRDLPPGWKQKRA